MSGSRVLVGSFGNWVVMRFAQTFLALLGCLLMVTQLIKPLSWQTVLVLVLWFGFVIYLDSCIYGFADESGLHFRRYVSMHFVPWEDIARVSWFGPNVLSFHLKRGWFIRRELNANSSPRSIIPDTRDPEVVRWLLVAKPPAADGVELTSWDSHPVLSRRVRLLVRIAMVVIAAATLMWILYNIALSQSVREYRSCLSFVILN